jgi:hypothetical protein
MTPRETGGMLEAIEQGTLLSRAASDEIKRIMMEHRQGTLRIPHYLPWPDYLVAHKTGARWSANRVQRRRHRLRTGWPHRRVVLQFSDRRSLSGS